MHFSLDDLSTALRKSRWFMLSVMGSWVGAGFLLAEPVRDYPYQPVPFTSVKVQDSFWSPRFETNRVRTVWYDFEKCEETGRIDNFAKAGKLMPGDFKGTPFDDSDVFKVVEGAAYILAMQPDPKLDRYLDELIAKIAAAQEPDGYLYTARTINPQGQVDFFGPTRFSKLAGSHELYNVGHMYEAAVAHYQATGKKSLLNVAIKNADYLCETFGPGKIQYPSGHEEIEIGLVKLYRATGQEKYLNFSKYLLDIRGRPETHKLYGAYAQDHQPVVEQSEAVGHAVRAGYMYAGMADVAAMTGNQDYVSAIGRIWNDVVEGKLHLTGGIGARPDGEAFGAKYELPNRGAYLETCAAIANALWNHHMFLLHGDAKYVDVLERILYNGFLSGISMTGDRFFYPNPLETDGRTKFNHGDNVRAPWFGCSCCPVNVVRFIPSIAGYIYATRGEELYVNLFVGGTAEASVSGHKVQLRQETGYPWDGKTRLTVSADVPADFTLKIRIPGWARGEAVPSDLYRYEPIAAPKLPPAVLLEKQVGLKVNGKGVPLQLDKGYAMVKRQWKAGDVVEFNLPMPVRRVLAHGMVKEDAGRVAVERGPILYCAEGADNGGKVLNKFLPDKARFKTEFRSGLLNGITVITAQGFARKRDAAGQSSVAPAELVLVPYYAWNHRGPNEMSVWLPRTEEKAAVAPIPTVAALSTVSASHVWANDSVTALNDQLEPAHSNDHSIPRLTWWDHRGSREWVQYEFQKPTRVSEARVYWFDDTGAGQCRVPASWRLLYKEGSTWKPLAGVAAYEVKKDAYSIVRFAPITTAGLRLEVDLQAGFSGGILEWQVGGEGTK